MTSIQIWLSRSDELAFQAKLQNKVWDELKLDPTLDPSGLGVDVSDDVATLGGTVASYPQKLAADRAAKRVPGVQAVKNEIVVVLPVLHVRTDEDLGRAVARALEWDVLVPPGRVTATVAGGWVKLEGRVESYRQRIAAEELVDRLIGVRGITNAIVVTPAARPDDLRARVDAALRRRAALHCDHIRVEHDGDAVVLHGRVRSLAEREEAERAALGVPGVAVVEDDLKVGS